MTASTDAQWEAYYAAQAECHKAKANWQRICAAAARLHPDPEVSKYAEAYELMANRSDRVAAELMGETA